MESIIDTLTIERFRAFRHLKIEGLGRVNLITGRNNTGKSSVLEALRILASGASFNTIFDILRYREEEVEDIDRPTLSSGADALATILCLFNGYPSSTDNLEPMVIESSGGRRTMKVAMTVKWFSEVRESDGSIRVQPQQKDLPGKGELMPGLDIIRDDGVKPRGEVALMRPPFPPPWRQARPGIRNEPFIPCVFVSPYAGEWTATLGPLWDKIALSDREKDVVEALRIIGPEISAVSMVGGELPRKTRTAIVRVGSSRPVPLRSFGDGMNRLFGIILSLVNAKGGLLLIDEVENGLHHTVQVNIWRTIFSLARSLDVQVVATSHSWDSIEAFQKAASEDPEEGVLVRLSRKGEKIIPTLFRKEELAIVTRNRIEVR